MATTSGSVAKAINNYWRSGIIGGLIIIDAVVLSICVLDSIRFALSGLSYGSALRVAVEEALEGRSVVLGIAVFAFFLFALPMVMALLFVFRPREHWPGLLGGQPQGLLSAHVFLSFVIALFTGAAVTMEVLSGWTRQQGVWRYSFVSLWLSAVFLGKPAYVAFISPIIRKFVVRASADPRATKLKEVAVEVLTEDNIERRAG
jgi:hypothetical protein